MNYQETEQKFGELLEVMARLRSEAGCPWDKEQTHLSLKPCLLEETYELLDALDNADSKKLQEELGDVLLQVIFHSQIASEESRFSIKEVIEQLTEKLVRRHPYVFAGEPLPEDSAAVLKQRMQIKRMRKRTAAKALCWAMCPKTCRHWLGRNRSRGARRTSVSSGPTSLGFGKK